MSTIIFLISSFLKKKGKVSIFAASLPLSLLPKISYQQDGINRKGYSIRDVAKFSGRGVSTVQRVKRLKIHNHSNKTINFTFFSKKVVVQ